MFCEAHPKLLTTEMQLLLELKNSTGEDCRYMKKNTVIQTGVQVKMLYWVISWVQLIGKDAVWWITRKSLWFCPLWWLEVTFPTLLAKMKGSGMDLRGCDRQPHRFVAGDINTPAFVRLDNQRVEWRFLHFWITKAKHKAKSILVITHPESHRHIPTGLLEVAASLQAQDAETAGAYLRVHRALSYHVLYWLQKHFQELSKWIKKWLEAELWSLENQGHSCTGASTEEEYINCSTKNLNPVRLNIHSTYKFCCYSVKYSFICQWTRLIKMVIVKCSC